MTSALDDATRDLRECLGSSRVSMQAPLAPLTTWKVGGPADLLVDVRESDELEKVVGIARRRGVPVTVMGGGSNVLVADGGVRGLVVRSHGGLVALTNDGVVQADAGVTINGLVRWTISRGLEGLQAWAGTPGTVGGAVCGNAHFDGRLIGECIAWVGLIAPDGTSARVPAVAMEFGYDSSRLQRTNEVVVRVEFIVTHERDPVALRQTARQSLAFRKQTQPLNQPTAGCVFRNPEPGLDSLPDGLPASAGGLIDRVGLKGHVVGGAQVSETHGNFIVNAGGATSADVRELIRVCRDSVAQRFGVVLREEIVYVGE